MKYRQQVDSSAYAHDVAGLPLERQTKSFRDVPPVYVYVGFPHLPHVMAESRGDELQVLDFPLRLLQ